ARLCGPARAQKLVARGAAYADYDLTGDLDVRVTTNNGPARLFRNDGGRNHAVRLALRGTTSNRDAIGARVAVTLADGARRWQMVRTGSSYLSQSDLPLTFGLGPSGALQAIEITWPNGRVERTERAGGGERGAGVGRVSLAHGGGGIVWRRPFCPSWRRGPSGASFGGWRPRPHRPHFPPAAPAPFGATGGQTRPPHPPGPRER